MNCKAVTIFNGVIFFFFFPGFRFASRWKEMIFDCISSCGRAFVYSLLHAMCFLLLFLGKRCKRLIFRFSDSANGRFMEISSEIWQAGYFCVFVSSFCFIPGSSSSSALGVRVKLSSMAHLSLKACMCGFLFNVVPVSLLASQSVSQSVTAVGRDLSAFKARRLSAQCGSVGENGN